jgi:hypothetical protein
VSSSLVTTKRKEERKRKKNDQRRTLNSGQKENDFIWYPRISEQFSNRHLISLYPTEEGNPHQYLPTSNLGRIIFPQ